MPHLSLTRRRWAVGTVTAVALTGLVLTPVAPASAGNGPARTRPVAAPTVAQVTLVTGDVVRVSTGADRKRSVVLEPRPDGTIPQASITQVRGHLYVVPTEAFGLLAAGRLDRALFDVTALLEDEYDDKSRPTLPVMVDYGKGAVAATEARTTTYDAARRTVAVPELGIAAYHARKANARSFWADLTKGSDTAGNPTGLTQGAVKVELDARVEVSLEDSVPQIHAPQAWAAGYDGTGATVAVLDTGYDTTHPDLQGLVAKSANFTTDASVNDGNGHGTHVASTVAGSGAASNGLRKGVAPGAKLYVGKVLADSGYGEDSMVLAGMAWAVDQGADVISMSLGGDTDDGSHPLSQAVNELSATSDSLFVIAAGNNGEAGPSTVTAPGAADAALTVGAVDVDNAMASFSGRGPRFRNGAIKPEVVAPGVDVTAARAAGTELGPVVDEYYTTISGTSMATPHVAGLAAILKQEHPDWDGEMLKSVIADSTVPVANATGFDAGTGRIDALQAIQQDVIAPASLSLGSYPWPYSDLDPTSTPLTYTNTDDAPVTLSLALANEDGSAEPTGSMSLGADEVTVPANGTATVNVALDPTIAAPGSYSAVVTATPDDGGVTVRTALSYLLEPEMYDVKVTIKPRAGSQSVSHQLGLNGYGEPWIFEQRNFDASPGEQSATFRLPPGTYATGVVSAGLAADGAKEGIVSYQPSFTVTENTEIVLDENDTRRFGYAVSRPVVQEGAIVDVVWNSDAGPTGFLYFGSADRVYARPSAGLPGDASVAVNWLLSQPEGLLTPRSGRPVALRPLTAPGASITETPVKRIDDTFRVIDAGTAAAPRTRHVRHAVALVSSECTDLTAATRTLKRAGAAAVVAYPTRTSTCAGTVDGVDGITLLQARAVDAANLLAARGHRAGLVTHKSPAYMYDLVKHWPDDVPNGGVVEARGTAVAGLEEHYRGLDSTSNDGALATEELVGWVPSRDGTANIGLTRRVPFPTTVTHYVSTDAIWERSVIVQDAALGGEYGRLWSPRQAVVGGTTTKSTWFGGVVGSRVSPLFSVDNGVPPPVREGDEFFISTGSYTDSAGHMAHSDVFAPEFSGRIYADGELILDMFASVFMNTTVPPGPHHYRVVTQTERENPFWQLSTGVKTEWQFDSDTPQGARSILPMLGVDYRTKLSRTNTAPKGKYTFRIEFDMPNGVQAVPIRHHAVRISWNEGRTWRSVPTDCSRSVCTVRVFNKHGKKASLRVAATDSAGRSVKQDVINAYAVR